MDNQIPGIHFGMSDQTEQGLVMEGQDKIGQIEPTAEIREGARAIAQVYKALLDEGFTEEQALYLVKHP